MLPLLLVAGASTVVLAQTGVESFRGSPLNPVPAPGITATTRGRDAFSLLATEAGLRVVLGEDVASKLGTKVLVLRVGARLVDDLLPPCANESLTDAVLCPKQLGRTLRDGPFDVTFGHSQPGMPGETIFRAYVRDRRRTGIHAICSYVMPRQQRLSCAVLFLHNGDEYRIDPITVTNDTDLGLLRCSALRLAQLAWPSVRPYADLCPQGS
jgi:hypothetical protein